MAKLVVVENEIENKQEKKVVVPRSAAEIQRCKLEKLLKKSVHLKLFLVFVFFITLHFFIALILCLFLA